MRTGRCSADGGYVPGRSSSDTLYDAAAAAGPETHAGGKAEELEVNCGGKKAQQGCNRASVCVPPLQHSANAKFNGNRWGAICMQINVHLDSLLKRVQRVRLCSHDTLLQWNRSERANNTWITKGKWSASFAQCHWRLRRLVRLWVWRKHGGCWKCDQRCWIRTDSFTLLCCIVFSVKNLWTPGGTYQCGLKSTSFLMLCLKTKW